MKLVQRPLLQLPNTNGFFTREGVFALRSESIIYWEHSARGGSFIDLATGQHMPTPLKASKYPGDFVASPDGTQVAVCEHGGWLKVITFHAEKKPTTKRVRLDPKLTISGVGFTAEHVVARGAYPKHLVTLHDRKTLEQVSVLKSVSGEGVAVSPAGVLFRDEDSALLRAPFTRPEKLAKGLIAGRFNFDGSALLVSDKDTGKYSLIDVTSKKVTATLKLDLTRNDELFAIDTSRILRMNVDRGPGEVASITLEVYVKAKKAASLVVKFDAKKKHRGLAERIAVGQKHLVLNAQTVIDIV